MPSNASAAISKLRVTIPSSATLTIVVPPNTAPSVGAPQDLSAPVDFSVTPVEEPPSQHALSSTPSSDRVLNSPRPRLSKNRTTRARQLVARGITRAPRRESPPQDLHEPVAAVPMEELPASAPDSPPPTLSKDRATRIRQLEARNITWAPRRKGSLTGLAAIAAAVSPAL
jgi:hypothetical protein